MWGQRLLLVGAVLLSMLANTKQAEAHGWGHWGRQVGWNHYAGYRYGGWGGYGVSYRANFYSPLRSCYHPVAYYRPYVNYYRPRVYSCYAPAYYDACSFPAYNVSYSVPFCANNYAPIYYPSQVAYGPQANQQFWGQPAYSTLVNNGNNDIVGTVAMIVKTLQAAKGKQLLNLPGNQSVPNQPAVQPANGAPQFIHSSPTPSLPLAKSRARSMLTLGDRYFREQKYSDAVTKYKDATVAAPDLAESFFRLGHAYTALGRVDAAATAFRRATAISTDITRAGFKLDDLYGDAQIAKRSQIESIAAAALEAPSQSDYLLVVGMFLHYDGQPERALKFLQRSTELGENPEHLVAYWNLFHKPAANTVLQVKLEADEI